MQDSFEGKSDHDLLVVAATELKHIKNHIRDSAKEAKTRDERIAALESWQSKVKLIFTFIGATWWLLIQELRQWVLEKFGFISSGRL